MKTLYLVRHAKSDWGDEFIRDIHRPLNSRGYSDAYAQSKKFAKEQKHPELIISSPATRAFTTACIFARELSYSLDTIRIAEKLYEASSSIIANTIAETDDSVSSVMVFGHNPGFTDAFDELSDSYVDNLPTCGIVGISFAFDSWADVLSVKGTCFLSMFPKDFKQ
ncbi:MAG: phosphohistidine phosphatase SixA [Bacteroidetes bacterium]|nr:phosphohistidine phosphatase SixA [Bacteroidota bacterium]